MSENPKTDIVTARIIFVGVMFGCINEDQRYEVGMVNCPKHHPTIQIADPSGHESTISWPAGHDLIFRVVNPEKKGVAKHLPEVDRFLTSFNFVVDVEGPDLHSEGIEVNFEAMQGRRIGVTDGLLYTHELTKFLDLMTWINPEDKNKFEKNFGVITKTLGLNIVCGGGKGQVDLVDAATGETLHPMPAVPNKTYTIVINNDCNQPNLEALNSKAPDLDDVQASDKLAPGASDFRFTYKVITPRNSKDPHYDFQLNPEQEPDPNPDVCNPTGGGKTKTIGLSFSKI
jgi:hypothetical protein